jgi:hypothetical protein
MRPVSVLLALIVVAGSMVWGARILSSDVELTPPNGDGLTCGAVYGSLRDKPTYGGEEPYPTNWVDQCEAAAKDEAVWLVGPTISGSAASIYLIGAFVMVVRRAKSEGRSTGAIATAENPAKRATGGSSQ